MPLLKTEVPRFERGETLAQRVEMMRGYLQQLQDRLDFLLQQLQTSQKTQELLNEYVTVVEGQLKLKGFVTATDLAESGRTVINGGNITTGVIASENGSTTLNLLNGEFVFGSDGDGSYGYLNNGQLIYRRETENGVQNAGAYLHPWLGTGNGALGLVHLISGANALQGIADLAYYAAGIASGADHGFSPGYVLNNGLDPDGYTERNIFYGDTAFDGDVTFGGHVNGAIGAPQLLWTNTYLQQTTLGAATLVESGGTEYTTLADELTNYNCFVITCHQTNAGAAQKRFVSTVCSMKDAADSDSVVFNCVDTALDSSWQIIVRQRTFTINRQAGTIGISTGYYGENGTSGGSYADTMVPISIYGLRI